MVVDCVDGLRFGKMFNAALDQSKVWSEAGRSHESNSEDSESFLDILFDAFDCLLISDDQLL